MPNDSSKTINVTSVEAVVSLCEKFQEELKGGGAPEILAYLGKVEKDAQPTLFKNLILLELRHLRTQGKSPKVDDYLARFPDFFELVRECFLENSLHSARSKSAAPRASSTLVIAKVEDENLGKTAIPIRLGSYELVKKLGQGAMGIVYEAIRHPERLRVALKTLPAFDGGTLHLFKQEFRSLAHINHPNLVGLYALESDGSHWFFAMDLIDGVDFLKFVRPEDKLNEANLRSAFSQIVAGVAALHSNQVLHRDLKPSNVMVASDGHLRLLDFGLVLQMEESRTEGVENLAGTPLYMAPEQAAGMPPSAASDWYAVGVMLYQALCGKLPFEGTIEEVLKIKQIVDAPPLPKDCAPADLAALCMRMLARDPEKRPGIAEILKVIAVQDKVILTPHSASNLVGRESHFEQLEKAFANWEKGEGSATIFVSGRSGEGKTTLAEKFIQAISYKHPVLLTGRCYDRETVPFKGVDSLIDHLASYLKRLPESEAETLIPHEISVLAGLFPVLDRVPYIAKISHSSVRALEDQQIQQRSVEALRELFTRIGQHAPLILFVDDLQWGDRASADMLFQVMRQPDGPKVLLIGTFRSDEMERSEFLQRWAYLERERPSAIVHNDVRVAPLKMQECVDLVVKLLGRDSESIRMRALELAAQTGGNALLLTELVGCFDASTGSFQALEMKQVLEQKFKRLPAGAETVLRIVALSGRGISLEDLAIVSKQDSSLASTISKMRNERLVRVTEPDGGMPFVTAYHDKVSENALVAIDDAEQRRIHLSIASVMEDSSGANAGDFVDALNEGRKVVEIGNTLRRVYDLAYHFHAAGDGKSAWVYSILAAERAVRQAAPHIAVQQYHIAEGYAEQMSLKALYHVVRGLGETLMLLGRYEEAKVKLEKAYELADDAINRAKIEVLLGELASKKAELKESIRFFESGLRRLGNWVPSTIIGYGWSFFVETIVQTIHTLFPNRLYRDLPDDKAETTTQLFFRSGYPYFFRNSIKAMWVQLSGMNRSEKMPPSTQLAANYATHALIMALLGWQSRAEKYLERSIKMRKQFDDTWGLGQTLCYKGICFYAAGKYEEAIAALAESITILDKAGDLWEGNLAHFHKGCCHFALGDLGAAIEEARIAFESSVRIGEDARAHCAVLLWAKATKGTVAFDELKSCYREVPDDVLSTDNAVLGEAYWHLHNKRTGRALTYFERAFQLAAENLVINFHTAETVPALAMGLRFHATAMKRRSPDLTKKMLRKAFLFAWVGRYLCIFFPAHYPFALREYAIHLALRGNYRRALKVIDKSCVVAIQQKARYEYAQSLREKGKILHKLRRPIGEAIVREADASLRVFESAFTSNKEALKPAVEKKAA